MTLWMGITITDKAAFPLTHQSLQTLVMHIMCVAVYFVDTKNIVIGILLHILVMFLSSLQLTVAL